MAEVVSGASTSKITRFSPYYPNARQIVSVPLTVIALTYSPDGKKFALSAYTGSNVVNLYTMNIDGTGLMRITNRAATFEYVSWSGFPKDRSLVAASGGSFGTRASGIIYTQQGPGTSSVLLLDVTTPSSLVMTQTTGLNANGPNLVFSVDADSITKMTYQNRSPYRGTKVIGPGASIPTANGALISIDSGSGQVVGVLPFNGSRSADSRPTFKDVGNTRVFTGAFLGVYDRSGVNVAPSGASEVRLDIATGKLTVH
jgi:Tol biopolymer transport system component